MNGSGDVETFKKLSGATRTFYPQCFCVERVSYNSQLRSLRVKSDLYITSTATLLLLLIRQWRAVIGNNKHEAGLIKSLGAGEKFL